MGELLRTPGRSILVRVLIVVVGAGLMALGLSTAAVVHIVGADKEAGLVDGAVRRALHVANGLDDRVDLARAELQAVAVAARHGDLRQVPDLVTGSMAAFRCMRDDEAILEAASDVEARRLLATTEPPPPGELRLVGSHLLQTERTGDITAVGLIDLSSVLASPEGWQASLARDADDGSDTRPGAVVAKRHASADGERIHAEALSHNGLLATVRAPLAPARSAAMRITREVVMWSLAAILPLLLFALLLGRAVTSPVRRLAQAVRSAGEAPVELPPLPRDEIGDLGHAIGGMSVRLHTERRALREAVGFSRRIGRLHHRSEILAALEDTLGQAFPAMRWRAVSMEAIQEGRLEGDIACCRDALRALLSAEDGKHRSGIEEDSGAWAMATSMPCNPGAVMVPLRSGADVYGALVSVRGQQDELEIRHVELLSRVAVAGLSNIELLQSAMANEKLAALGRLSASVAHEMNNPLAFVLTNAELLAEDLDGPLQEAARDVREGAERLARIVQDLSSLSRGGFDVHPTEHGLGEMVRSAVKLARAQYPNVTIELHECTGGRVWCDAGRVEQILLNLIGNACDVVEGREGPRVVVRSRVDHGHAVLEVTDNGGGIPDPVREHLFEPFFTTKGRKGTGLGLFLSRSLAQAHGGMLELAESGADGTTFRLRLPEATSDPLLVPAAPSGLPAPAQGGLLRILVVDDEAAIVRSMQRWLGRRAEVTGTSDPREGLRLAQEQEFDLVLCDIHMPGLSGPELAEALHQGRPHLAPRLVLMSGSREATHAGYEVLHKPISPSELDDVLRVVHRATGGEPAAAC